MIDVQLKEQLAKIKASVKQEDGKVEVPAAERKITVDGYEIVDLANDATSNGGFWIPVYFPKGKRLPHEGLSFYEDVLRQQERDVERVRREIQALLTVIPLLDDHPMLEDAIHLLRTEAGDLSQSSGEEEAHRDQARESREHYSRTHPGPHGKSSRRDVEAFLTSQKIARMVLLKNFRLDEDTTYRDYKKFRTNSKIVGMGEVRAKIAVELHPMRSGQRECGRIGLRKRKLTRVHICSQTGLAMLERGALIAGVPLHKLTSGQFTLSPSRLRSHRDFESNC